MDCAWIRDLCSSSGAGENPMTWSWRLSYIMQRFRGVSDLKCFEICVLPFCSSNGSAVYDMGSGTLGIVTGGTSVEYPGGGERKSLADSTLLSVVLLTIDVAWMPSPSQR